MYTLSQEEMEHLKRVLAHGNSLSREEMECLVRAIAHNGSLDKNNNHTPLPDGFIKRVADLVKNSENDPTFVNVEHYNTLMLCKFAIDIEEISKENWWIIDTDVEVKRKQIEDAWNVYVENGVIGILKTLGFDEDFITKGFTWIASIGQWFEDNTVSNLLFALMRIKGYVTKKSLTIVASRLGEERWKKMSAFLEHIEIIE
jgi:hypothetical protein